MHSYILLLLLTKATSIDCLFLWLGGRRLVDGIKLAFSAKSSRVSSVLMRDVEVVFVLYRISLDDCQ
jgi:hypothetical protein